MLDAVDLIMNNDKVYIVILNWNGWQDTIECLESIQQLDYSHYRIVLLDNGSTDNSLEQIKAWAVGKNPVKSRFMNYRKDNKKIHIVNYDRDTAENGGIEGLELKLSQLSSSRKLVIVDNKENLGFAAGCNVGIQYALATGVDYIWLLNNDTVLEQNALSYLVDLLETNTEYEGVTGQIRLYDNPSEIWNCGGSLTCYGCRKYHHAGKSISKIPQLGVRKITFITGCAALFRSSIFRDTGLLSERFFFGEEDFELSLRMKKIRYNLACCYQAIIYHKIGKSINSLLEKKEKRLPLINIYYLNRFINMRSHWPFWIWNLWRFAYLLYMAPMLKLRYRFSWRSLWLLCMNILRDSNRLDKVDKGTFETLIRGNKFDAS